MVRVLSQRPVSQSKHNPQTYHFWSPVIFKMSFPTVFSTRAGGSDIGRVGVLAVSACCLCSQHADGDKAVTALFTGLMTMGTCQG